MPLLPRHRDHTRAPFASILRSRLVRAFSLLLLGPTVILPAPVSADDGVFVLPHGAASIEIAEADLLDTLPGATGPVLGVTPAGRGFLFALAGTEDTYLPFAEFFARGSDTYHFEARFKDASLWGTAFLVAAMKGDGRFFMTLEDPGELESLMQTNESSIHWNSIDPIHGAHDLLFELEPGSTSFVTYSEDGGDGLGDGPKGGTLGGGIDPGGGFQGGGADVVFALAKDGLGQGLSRVVLLDEASGPQIAGDVMVDGNFVRLGQAAVSAGSTWELQWWGATARGSRDGGGLLLIDGVAVATRGELDNPELERPVSWSYGALGNSGVGGTLQLDDLRGEAAVTVPRIAPIFADNFEAQAPVWSDWDCGRSPLPAAVDGVLAVPLDTSGHCFVSRVLDQPERQLKARWTFDMEGAVLGAGQEVSLFRGLEAGGGENPIELLVRRSLTDGALEIAVRSIDGDQPLTLGWFQIAESGEVEVEIHWWAATSHFAVDGGLKLRIDGYPRAERLAIDNVGVEVSELALGAMEIGDGNSGQVSFGAFEVCR